VRIFLFGFVQQLLEVKAQCVSITFYPQILRKTLML